MPYKVFVAGEEALAADANSFLMSQTVPRFTNAAQRTSQLTAPVLNQLSMRDDGQGILEYWNGSAWTASVGPTWRDYTPTWQGGTAAPGLGNGTITGRYVVLGKLCLFFVYITFGSTTTGGQGVLAVTLPVTPYAGVGGFIGGTATTYVPSVGIFHGKAHKVGANTASALFSNSSTDTRVQQWIATATGGTGTSVPLAPGSYCVQSGGDFQMQGFYEIA